MESLRLFVGIDTPAQVKELLDDLRATLARSGADVHWEQKAKLHCTLRFLGEVSGTLLDPLTKALESAVTGIGTLSLVYAGIGFFPDRNRPRILWIGIEESSGTLLQLQRQLEGALIPLGVPTEGRPFHAHVTLGRIRSPRKLSLLLESAESCTFQSPPVTVHEVNIVRSVLTPRGSVYSVLRSVPLAQAWTSCS